MTEAQCKYLTEEFDNIHDGGKKESLVILTMACFLFLFIIVPYELSIAPNSFLSSLKTLGCTNLDDLAQFDSQLQLSLAAWGYYYEDYIKLSTGIKVLQASRGSRDQDYEVQLVHSLAERRLNEKWSIGEFEVVHQWH